MDTIILALAVVIVVCLIFATISLILIAHTLWNILQELKNK